MTALAVIGMIVLLLVGATIFVAGLQVGFGCMMWGGKFEPLSLVPMIFGGLLIWLACHLCPWTITVQVA